MRLTALLGGAIMMMALVGCGSSEDDKLYNEMEKSIKDIIALQEKAKADPKNAQKYMGEMFTYFGQMAELEKKVKALPKDRQDALEKRVKAAPWAKNFQK
jgi:hypothetical protein